MPVIELNSIFAQQLRPYNFSKKFSNESSKIGCARSDSFHFRSHRAPEEERTEVAFEKRVIVAL